MSTVPATPGSLQWLSTAIKKHENDLARRVRHRHEIDAGHLRADIDSLIAFCVKQAPKKFREHVLTRFQLLSPFTLNVLDRYSEFDSDPHYRTLRNSKSEMVSQLPKPKKATLPAPLKKVPEPPASDVAPTPTPPRTSKSELAPKPRPSSPPPAPPKQRAPRERPRTQPPTPAPLVPPAPFPYGPVIPVEALSLRFVSTSPGMPPVVQLGDGDSGPPQPRSRRRPRR
ncbi:hypothetical protein PAPYR_5426 [Paratrimastix pyriformis]|uniref:Uncharacterized protein n=1 Tax=Paratrimastix pyriformis TaxID=342808 RepID=A0ABQ8ULV1_9EUKA|nr:hypothetical protein PAPYR_5426 [Paratrimastix pyriformis]